VLQNRGLAALVLLIGMGIAFYFKDPAKPEVPVETRVPSSERPESTPRRGPTPRPSEGPNGVLPSTPVDAQKSPAEREEVFQEFSQNPERVVGILKDALNSYRQDLEIYYRIELGLNIQQIEEISDLNARFYLGDDGLSPEAGLEVISGRLFSVDDSRKYLTRIEEIVGSENFTKIRAFRQRLISEIKAADSFISPLFDCCIDANLH
jgi:hypothetical protein